jgi:3-keto-disaccharide hydrolase/Secretion system C-terminal sorting domain/FG-GAP-like repeat
MRKKVNIYRIPNSLLIISLFLVSFISDSEKEFVSEDGIPDFVHGYISPNLPTIHLNGVQSLADYDNDGDLDFTVGSLPHGLYLYRNNGTSWSSEFIDDVPYTALGTTNLDINNDGWIDLISAGVWYQNNSGSGFIERKYDYGFSTGDHFHDIVSADLNNDGVKDVIGIGDDIGFFWYDYTSAPTGSWTRTRIDPDYPDWDDHVHGAFSPGGIGDLDMDGDNDIWRANAWFENQSDGQVWVKHEVTFPELFTGDLPYGKSTRSMIIDIDDDGDNDIVISECDDVDGKVGILENTNGDGSVWTLNLLPQTVEGRRGSLHSLCVKDLDMDGKLEIVTIDQEDMIQAGMPSPRWYIYTRDGDTWTEHVLLSKGLGGHELMAKDVDQDGDIDLVSKSWYPWSGNALSGNSHADILKNNTVEQAFAAIRFSADVTNNWTQTGGLWEQKGDLIIGGKDPLNPDNGGLLMTEKSYGDFEIVLDVWPDYGIDSGIFLRTNSDGSKAYQVTIDYQPDNPMGGVYLSGMDASANWDFTILDADKIQGSPANFHLNAWSHIWNTGDWNQFRVRIEGNPATITTWINGWKVNEYTDTQVRLGDEGKVGLQVHTGDDWAEGKIVRFKNIKLYPLQEITGIEKDQTNEIAIYPSPVDDHLNLTNLPDKCSIMVYDMGGKKMMDEKVRSSPVVSQDMSDLQSGIYIVQVLNQNAMEVQNFKIIKN